MTMSLVDAFQVLATAGCRFSVQPPTGLALDVPAGAEVPAAVLETLAAHREEIAAAMGLSSRQAPLADEGADPDGEEIADHLARHGIYGSLAELITHASDVFGVRLSGIRIEPPGADRPAEFFAPGWPVRTRVETLWHEPGRISRTIPAGAIGLAMPQPWAVADAFERRGLLNALRHASRTAREPHVAIWLEGRPRTLAISDVELDSSVPTEGMDLMPWRRATPGAD